MHERDRQVVWAISLDATRTRGEGRKIPKSLAIPNPTLTEIVQAATQLGLNPQATEASHPRTHRQKTGYVKISKQPHKLQSLKQLAQKISENRAQTPR